MKKKILISAANGVVMESLIRILKKSFYVVGTDTQNLGNAKNYCDEFYLSPDGKSKKFINFLYKISSRVDLIFLYVDEEIRNVNKNREKLKKISNKLILSNFKTIEICTNKILTSKFFTNSSINIPAETYSKQMIAKPVFGRGSKNLFYIDNKKDFLFFKKKKNYFVQKFINGKEYTVDCLFDKNGNLIFHLVRERILHKSVSIIGKTIKDKSIDKIIIKISSLLKFYGPINIQVIKDKNKKIWLIEINPRLSGSVEFSILAGFNPLIYFTNKKINSYKIKYDLILKRYLSIS
jgi:carbamoyl-phosphate synthase large subunit